MELSHHSTVHVEVVYALPHRQVVVALEVPAGTTVREAAVLSDLDKQFPGLEIAASPLGVFGTVVEPDRPAADGDRIEIYRPLIADPKEARRRRAAANRTAGEAQDSASTTRSTTSSTK